MKDLRAYFQDYSSFHRTPGNKVCHYVGIPLIMLSLLGLLSAWVIPGLPTSEYLRLDAGTLLVLASTLWYLKLEWRLGAPFFFIAMAFYFVGRMIPTPILWGVFIAGWIFQGIGHYKYEKKSPAFFKNLEHILIGPLWIFASLIGY